ncbi:MAG: class III extradiol ring-cleavage dioxygenase [Bdellovibrionota bacterium]
MTKLPTYFISHGGGPWPWLKKEMPFYAELEKSLKAIPFELPYKPKAILMISGHWEASEFTVMATPKPPMIYDYGGFPEHTYKVRYEAPGSPEVAARVKTLIEAAGLTVRVDSERGFDHGTFTPLVEMYPDADVPVLQLSLKSDYDPETHVKLGRALAPLREEGVLIIGSGLSYHNLRLFGKNEAAKKASKEFDDYLQDAVVQSTPENRHRKLLNWASAPSARISHPEEDHLLPLMVAVGAAENEKAELIYHEEDFMGAITASSFRFGSIENV